MQSKSKIVFDALRDRILLNQLRPGDMVGEIALAEEFGVSRTPVRQALQRLADIGLVEIRDGAGTFVTQVKFDAVRNAYKVRCTMEKLALETSVNHISAEELDALEARFQSFIQQLNEGGDHIPYEEMAYCEWELHDLIIERSENDLIATAVERATPIMRRYQVATISRYLRAAYEHVALIARIRNKDVPGAQRIIDQHLAIRTR